MLTLVSMLDHANATWSLETANAVRLVGVAGGLATKLYRQFR